MGVQQKPVRDDAHESILDLARIFAGRDVQAIGDAEDMGVDGERRLPESGVQHHVRGLAANAGEGLQRLAVAGRFAAVLLDDRARKRDDVLRLGAIEPDGFDQVGNLLHAERRHLLGRVGDGEQRGRCFVHARVGRLRRQHHGYKQCEGVDVFEFALRGGIGGGQALEYRLGSRRSRLPGLSTRHGRFIGARRGRAKRSTRLKRKLPCVAPPSIMPA